MRGGSPASGGPAELRPSAPSFKPGGPGGGGETKAAQVAEEKRNIMASGVDLGNLTGLPPRFLLLPPSLPSSLPLSHTLPLYLTLSLSLSVSLPFNFHPPSSLSLSLSLYGYSTPESLFKVFTLLSSLVRLSLSTPGPSLYLSLSLSLSLARAESTRAHPPPPPLSSLSPTFLFLTRPLVFTSIIFFQQRRRPVQSAPFSLSSRSVFCQ